MAWFIERGQVRVAAFGAVLQPRDVRVRGTAFGARRQNLLREAAEVFDQRQLQHARPGPELADRQRGDALIAVEKLPELLRLQPAVAVTDELDGDGVNAGVAGLRAPSVGSSR